ncbi:MAG: hypothetical protein QXW03_05495, partial [Candidatus Nezhaarchaeales archaeon]
MWFEVGEKPTTAFVLSLIGGILILVNGVAAAIFVTVSVTAIVSLPGQALCPICDLIAGLMMAIAILALAAGVLVILGSVMINSGVPRKVRTGSILVVVFSVISLVVGGGFIIGFALALAGGVAGLVW